MARSLRDVVLTMLRVMYDANLVVDAVELAKIWCIRDAREATWPDDMQSERADVERSLGME